LFRHALPDFVLPGSTPFTMTDACAMAQG